MAHTLYLEQRDTPGLASFTRSWDISPVGRAQKTLQSCRAFHHLDLACRRLLGKPLVRHEQSALK